MNNHEPGNLKPVLRDVNSHGPLRIEQLLVGFLVHLLLVLSAHAQGAFQNLDFEQANPGMLTMSYDGIPYALNVPVGNALPYWTVDYGTVQQSVINVNDPNLGATGVTLITSASSGYPLGGTIDGNYSVLLQGGTEPTVAASISQTGLIPVGTQSLLFEAEGGGDSGPREVFIGNQSVFFTAVGLGPNYNLYGANISTWAGQMETLSFSALSPSPNGLNNWLIDDIMFSTSAVPEPGTLALLLVGGAGFGLRRWRALGS